MPATIEHLHALLSTLDSSGPPATALEVTETLWLACHLAARPDNSRADSGDDGGSSLSADAGAAGCAMADHQDADHENDPTGPGIAPGREGLYAQSVDGKAFDAASVLVTVPPLLQDVLS